MNRQNGIINVLLNVMKSQPPMRHLIHFPSFVQEKRSFWSFCFEMQFDVHNSFISLAARILFTMPLFCCWQLEVDTTVNLPITILRFQKYLDHLFTCDCHLSHICVNDVALSTAKSDIQASNKEIFCNFKQYNNDDVTVMVTNSLGQFSYCLAALGSSSTQALSSDPENNDNLGRVKVLEENVTKVHEALVRKKSYS